MCVVPLTLDSGEKVYLSNERLIGYGLTRFSRMLACLGEWEGKRGCVNRRWGMLIDVNMHRAWYVDEEEDGRIGFNPGHRGCSFCVGLTRTKEERKNERDHKVSLSPSQEH